MCFLKPLKVERIIGKTVFLENGLKAFYDKKIGLIKANDLLLVFGNLVVEKVKRNEKSK